MSAIITFQQPDRVTMLTDGAVYKLNGELTGQCPKVFPLPHLNAAIAVRGIWASLALIGGALTTEADRYDDIEKCLPDILRLIEPKDGQGDPCEVWCAGFSETRGPDTWVMANSDASKIPPFTAIRAGSVAAVPGSPAVAEQARKLIGDDTALATADVVAAGLEIMKTQRGELHHVTGRAGGELLYIVGAFVQATEITRGDITTRIIHRWPDRRGETIQP